MALWPDVGIKYKQDVYSPGEGVDKARSPVDLSPGQASDMQDFSSRLYPALQTRDGRRQLYAPFVGSIVRRIHVSPTGVVHALFGGIMPLGGGSNWYYWNTTTSAWALVDGSSATYAYSFADWYDASSGTWFVYHSRYDNVSGYGVTWWDGSAVQRILHSTFSASPGPMCSHLNRMFCTHYDATAPTAGNLGFSKLFDPSVWASPDGGVIPVGARDNINVLLSMPDRLFIGTDKGIYVLFGSDEETFSLKPVTTTIGIPDGESACATQDAVYFTDGNSVYEYTISGIRDITRPTAYNGVLGGFEEYPRDSVDTSVTAVRRLYGIGTDGNRLYVTTNSVTSGRADWYVFDIKKRRWYIERGTYQTSNTTSFARTPDNRMLASSYYYASGYYQYPRIMELDANQAYDTYTQYNLVSDAGFADAAAWTAVGGTDAVAGGMYQVTGNGSAAAIGTYQDTAHTAVVGQSVYAKIKYRVTDAVCSALTFEVRGSTGGSVTVSTTATPTVNEWYTVSAVVPIGVGSTGVLRPYITATYANAGAANGKILECDYIIVDNVSFSYEVNNLPTKTDYESDLPVAGYFNKTNPTSYWNTYPSYVYVSPAFQISPSSKKTLKNIYISADLTGILQFSVGQSTALEGTTFTTIYNTLTAPSAPGVTRIKVPVSTRDKAEWVRIKIFGTGQVKILNITLDWRIAERVR